MTASRPPATVGRDAELRSIRRAIQGAVAGHGEVLAMTGPPGIGKTHLARTAADEARAAGAIVTWGRAEYGGSPPYWIWTQVVRDLLAAVPRAALLPVIADRGRALAPVVPELDRGGEGRPPPTFDVLDATATLLETAAEEQPLLVILDDVQWSTPTSLDLLRFVAPRVPSLACCVIVLFRDEASGDPRSGALLADAVRSATRLALSGLDLADSVRLARERGVDPGGVAELHRLTEGNPFLLDLLVQPGAPPAGGPGAQGLLAIAESRLRDLDDATVSLLELVAVVGAADDIPLLAAVAGVEPSVVAEARSTGVAAGLLEADERGRAGPRLGHHLLREALEARLDPVRRATLHLEVGTALRSRGEPALLPRVAHHLRAALPLGDPEEVVAVHERAADVALARRAYDDAAEVLREALAVAEGFDLPAPRVWRLLVELARAELKGSGGTRAIDSATRAVEVARQGLDGTRFGEAVVVLADALNRVGSFGLQAASLGLVAEAAARREEITDPMLRSELLAREARFRAWTGDPAAAAACAERALAEVDVDRSERACASVVILRGALGTGGALDRQRELSTLAAQLADDADDDALRYRANRWAIVDAAVAGDRTGLLAAVERERALAARVRQPALIAWARTSENGVALLEGRYDEAQASIDEIVAARAEAGIGSETLWWQSAVVARARGADAGLEGLFDLLARSWPQLAVVRAALALAQAEAGHVEAAQGTIDALASDDFAVLRADALVVPAGALAAQAIGVIEDPTHAAALDDLLATFGDRCVVDEAGAMVWLGALRHYRGLLRLVLGDVATALVHLEQGLAVHEAMRARPWVAESHVAIGRALVARGRPADLVAAREHVDVAARLAARLGSPRLLSAVDAVAAALVESPDQRAEFRRIDDAWRLRFEGRTAILTPVQGLAHLQAMLRTPGRPVDATELAGKGADVDEAEAERARVNVARTVRGALTRIRSHHPDLYAHLAASIRTGRRCVYEPPPGDPPDWRLD